jgi:hypothetical protein
VLILVRVVPDFCTYQWEVQKCTIETYKSGARPQPPGRSRFLCEK